MNKLVRRILLLRSANSENEVFENKIFSIVALVVACTSFLAIIPNIYSKISFLTNLIAVSFGIIAIVFFYLSFFRGITKPLIIPFQILIAFGLTLNWFYLEGIDGAMPLFFIPAMVLLIYGNQEKKYWSVFIGFVSLAIVLVAIHYLFPEWVISYPDEEARIIDISFSFIILLFMLGYATIVLKKNFDLERSKTEQKNKELDELNAAKDKFFSILSHDLRSPFNAIIGFSDILVEQVQEKNYNNIEEYARIIHDSSLRAMDLLMNLLEWSRSQTGKIEFNPKTIDLAEMINEVSELANDTAQHKLISIVKKIPASVIAIADKSMISTVLRNLISNAIKFTLPGGEIVISAEQKLDELVVTVSDNGVGIKKDVVDKLFRIDENHTTSGTLNEEGTGLGLILCKEFIEKHSGKIWVESEVGKGSAFSFSIPKRKNN